MQTSLKPRDIKLKGKGLPRGSRMIDYCADPRPIGPSTVVARIYGSQSKCFVQKYKYERVNSLGYHGTGSLEAWSDPGSEREWGQTLTWPPRT